MLNSVANTYLQWWSLHQRTEGFPVKLGYFLGSCVGGAFGNLTALPWALQQYELFPLVPVQASATQEPSACSVGFSQ